MMEKTMERDDRTGLYVPERGLSVRDQRKVLNPHWNALFPSERRRIMPSISGGADGLFYNDLREPFIGVDIAPVTLLTTDLPLYPPSNFPVLGGQYFSRIGKKLRVRLFGKLTTVLTPGNGTFDIYYGTGAAANGVLLASSAAMTLLASQTTLSWECDISVHCRSIGSTGTLFCRGNWRMNAALVTAGFGLIPAGTAVVSAACDLTAALIISVQYKRSGATAEVMTVQDMEVIALN
jgi:hypothetical protein